jgi:hypothetical protein
VSERAERGVRNHLEPSRIRISNYFCLGTYNKIVGGRKGWRPPKVEELSSLIDPLQSAPTLPSGHPFTNVQVDDVYWAYTPLDGVLHLTIGGEGTFGVSFGDGAVGLAGAGANQHYMWCVRGGH